jgi:transcriptional antiterminator RfaH
VTWYAVQTKPRQEGTAALNLQRQNFHTYLPKIRLRKRHRQQWHKVVEPLFPGYLFIKVAPGEQSTAPVRSTLGVVGLVRFGSQLHSVPPQIINYLKQHEESGADASGAVVPGAAARDNDEWPHQHGDVVQVLDGPFAGLSGVYQMEKDQSRALLLIDLLGRSNTVVVEQCALG